MPTSTNKAEELAYQQALNQLTPGQLEIIVWLNKLHIATRSQLQEIFGHKSHSRVSTWLADLVDKQFVGVRFFLKSEARKKPWLYHLDSRGYRALVEYFGEQNNYLRYKISHPEFDSRYITHDWMVVEFFLCFVRYARSRNHRLEHLGTYEGITQEYEGTYFDEHEMGSNILSEPDAVLKYASPESKIPAVFYVEFDRHNMSGPKFLLKINRYLRFYKSKQWQDRYQDFPMVLIVTVNSEFLKTIFEGIEERLKVFDEIEDLFRLTTWKAVQEHGVNGRIWHAPFRPIEQTVSLLN